MILAHDADRQTGLPVTLWVIASAAALAVLATFLLVTTLSTKPRLRGSAGGRAFPEPLQRLGNSAITRANLQIVGVAAFSIVLIVSWLGPSAFSASPAPTWFYVWFWVGVAGLSLVFGDFYRYANPLRTASMALAGVLGVMTDRSKVLDRLRYWPAAVSLSAFLWLDLICPVRDSPRVVAGFITAYAVLNVAAGVWFGPRWFDRGDGFAVYFSLFGRMSPFGRRDDGKLVVRNPLDGLLAGAADRGLAPVLLIALGSTVLEGIVYLPLWADLRRAAKIKGPDSFQWALLDTAGLLGAIAVVAALYTGMIWASSQFVQPDAGSAFDIFACLLIPILIGYTIARYLSSALFESQAGYLIAVGGGATNYRFISTAAISLVQIAAIVGGQIVALISANERARQVLRPGFVMIGQLPIAALMNGYTIVGIALLVGG